MSINLFYGERWSKARGGKTSGEQHPPEIARRAPSRTGRDACTESVEKAEAGDGLLLKFMLEQIYGKAPQPLTGDKDNSVYLAGVEITVRKK